MLTARNTLELTGRYELDPAHTRIGFAAQHAMVTTVRGQFGAFDGGMSLDADAPHRSRAELVVETASITTGQAQRDEHLRGPDFFDADTYPEMVFVSTATEQLAPAQFALQGDLTIRDVTRPVTVDVAFHGLARDPSGQQRAGFTGSAVVVRSAFGLTYNAALEFGGFLISDEIRLELDVAGVRQPRRSW